MKKSIILRYLPYFDINYFLDILTQHKKHRNLLILLKYTVWFISIVIFLENLLYNIILYFHLKFCM